MFTIMAIDWGEKRFGLAFGNKENQLVIPCKKACYTASIWLVLAEEIRVRNIQTVVIGLPSNFAGGDTLVTTNIRNFITAFKQQYPQLTIYTVNERGSSQQAKKQLQGFGDAHDINHLAAQDILHRWLERISLTNIEK